MSTPKRTQQNIDFSRKCRDRVNFFFQKLKISLKKIPEYQSTHLNWNRFEILERALQQIQIIDGKAGAQLENIMLNNPNRKDLNNKELCQLYRTRLNLGFDKLRNILEQKPELAQFRLFSRAGLLEATVHYLETKTQFFNAALPKPYLKRERSDEEDEMITPTKIPKQYFNLPVYPNNLNTSIGVESPDSGFSPPVGVGAHIRASQTHHLYSLELARAQLIAYNRLILLNNASQMTQIDSKQVPKRTASVWRPW